VTPILHDHLLVRPAGVAAGAVPEAGIIDLDRGAPIFEQAREQALIERRQEREERKREWGCRGRELCQEKGKP
jgi:hypothetical protein